MRASRLLRLLLLLQNRGRLTCAQLATELEVARRTVLRDIDALCEAGLPVIVVRGSKGGIELGFNYRSRLTGLAHAEAEALGVLLGSSSALLTPLGLESAGRAARTKLLESLPDGVRETAMVAGARFRDRRPERGHSDPRIEAIAGAIRERRQIRIRARSAAPHTVHPVALVLGERGWALVDARTPERTIPLRECGDINISARTFEAIASPPGNGSNPPASARHRPSPGR